MRFLKFMFNCWLICGATGLASAADLAMNNSANLTVNPYAPIVARNIFGLLAIPTNPPVDPNAQPTTPPPKITPNGIMTLFGVPQALFKVAWPPHAGDPAKDQSYVLSQGESQDNIEVTKIDQPAGIITFNNNGVEQVLPLAAAPKITAPASPITTPGGGFGGGTPLSTGGDSGGIPRPLMPGGSTAKHAHPLNANSGNDNAGNPMSFGSSATADSLDNNISPENRDLSPEASVLMMEKNRLDTQDAVDKGLMPAIPPTALTPGDATAADGASLFGPDQSAGMSSAH